MFIIQGFLWISCNIPWDRTELSRATSSLRILVDLQVWNWCLGTKFHPKMSVGTAWDSRGMGLDAGSSRGHLHICPSRSRHKIHSGLHWFSSGKENSRGSNGGSRNTAHPRAGRCWVLFHPHIRNPTAFPISGILPHQRDEMRDFF